MNIQPGQVWRKSDHERITIQEVDGNTISGALSDTKAGTTSVWVGAPENFDSLELITDSSDG